jgi:hypothetical protein
MRGKGGRKLILAPTSMSIFEKTKSMYKILIGLVRHTIQFLKNKKEQVVVFIKLETSTVKLH